MLKFNIPIQEIENFSKNLEKSKEKIKNISNVKKFKIRKNIYMDITTKINEENTNDKLKKTKSKSAYTTEKFYNIFGATIITLKVNGTFSYTGKKAKPTDYYSSYSATGWSISRKCTKKTGWASTGYVRYQWNGKLGINTAWINIDFQSFSGNLKLSCSKSGKISSSWG